ncbi:DNRLRE domain-containing protein [Segetibacter aerophilus]|uniref:Secretion system C-terminal sorting domain-containing protein n=1 Tax=Segetibacter aerophilus TaxID=670293 RepID=A0A512BIM3_9BACT|nr:DNRLRE domain-containing protein [Segetibacter aerophilus]GEO11814.1 hypothetical protein SAE01_43100 [Segetibacter aerophilus]
MQKLYITLQLLLLFSFGNAQTTVSLGASKDNTIYSAFTGNSNGQGEYFFVGKNAVGNAGSVQRALLQFDLSTIPANATITSAILTVYVNKSAPTATGLELRKLNAAWGEGTSDAAGREAQGATATTNDATWLQRVSPTLAWTTAGGDFSPTVSASVQSIAAGIGSPTAVTMQGVNVTADVQSWVANSSSNFGWILKANDETLEASVKRFVSKNSASTAQRPSLSVTYQATLPITLKGFSASLSRQNALLKWSTSTEIDNDRFEIEHSLNGRDFLTIAEVKANGASTTEHSYSYLHENISAGKHFYRITDVDKSGHRRYSQIITLSSMSTPALQVYPNPATSFISVTTSSVLKGAEFSINSLAGQLLLRGKLSEQQIDIQKLPAGQYWLTLKTNSGELMKAQFLKK